MLSPTDLKTIKDAGIKINVDKMNSKVYEIKPDDLIQVSKSGHYEYTINHGLNNDQLLCRVCRMTENKAKISLHFEDNNNVKISCSEKVHLILYIIPDTFMGVVPGVVQGISEVHEDFIDDKAGKTDKSKTYSAKKIHELLTAQEKAFQEKLNKLTAEKTK